MAYRNTEQLQQTIDALRNRPGGLLRQHLFNKKADKLSEQLSQQQEGNQETLQSELARYLREKNGGGQVPYMQGGGYTHPAIQEALLAEKLKDSQYASEAKYGVGTGKENWFGNVQYTNDGRAFLTSNRGNIREISPSEANQMSQQNIGGFPIAPQLGGGTIQTAPRSPSVPEGAVDRTPISPGEASDANINQVLAKIPGGQGSQQGSRFLTPEERAMGVARGRSQGSSGGLYLTPGQEAMDKEFAGQLTEWTMGGGYATAMKNLDQVNQQLTSVKDAVASGQNLSGPALGLVPPWIRGFFNAPSVDTQEQVAEAIQSSLRQTLGAQFTEKEGQGIIDRAYNTKLDEKTNLQRVERLFKQLSMAAMIKQQMAEYYEQNGTIQGFPISLGDLQGMFTNDTFIGGQDENIRRFDINGNPI